MREHNDFEIISPQDEPLARRRLPTWVWLLVALGVVLLAFAAGMAFATFSNRMNSRPNPTPEPALTPTGVANAPLSTITSTTISTAPTLTRTRITTTSVPTLAPTLTPTPTRPTVCSIVVNQQFAPYYVPSELGCPLDAGVVVWAAWEPFERGAMLWRSDTDRAYAFFADGLWLTVDERWDNKEIPSRGEPPAGLVAPVRGFGYVWSVREDLFQRLGWARTEEKGFCALIQSFDGGFILQSDTVEFCREQLYNQARAPDWTPLRIIATYDGLWRSQ